MPDLRKQFFSVLCDVAKDPKVILLTGDLGYSFFEEYQAKHPNQFINCGIAEQGMVGIAAGMALGGLKPYVYSGTNFLIFRALEQIRNDVAYNNLNVKLIGTGASPFLGFSHNLEGTENEEAILKNLPNLKRFYPQDEKELRKALLSGGPAFIRI
jgi:transketolase